MEVFANLFNDLTGWLTIAILVSVLAMMGVFVNMMVKKSRGDGS